jgi:hypothetical protein
MTAPIIDEQVSKADEEKVEALAEIEQVVMSMEVLFLKAKAEYKFTALNDMTTQVLRFWVMSLPSQTKSQMIKKLEQLLFNLKKSLVSMVDIRLAQELEYEKTAKNITGENKEQ